MKWNFLHVNSLAIEKKYSVGSLTGKLFAAAKLTSTQIDELLSTDTTLSTSHATCVLAACARITQAKQNHEKVFIAGDYDADGVCSTAIMKATLDAMKIKNGFYIPDRIKEGYGLQAKTVKSAASKGYSLIITVDNGVKAHAALQEAVACGIDTIVTDHHIIEEEVETKILVHPTLMEEEYRNLSGAGVALEISRNLIGNQEELNAFAGIASVTDVMPMWKETRKLVMRAMDLLKQGIPASLSALLQPGSEMNETTIGFNIGPKLNSVGRMSDVANVNTVPTFLLLEDERAIANYASQLTQVNELRKERADTETQIAIKQIQDEPFLLIFDENFHEGVCGQIAGNIANTYQRPTLVMARSGNIIKGSGRSVEGFNIYDFFHDFTELCAFGGHAMAVGISVNVENWDIFKKHIQSKMATMNFVHKEEEKSAIQIDADEITFDSLSDLQRISPYPSDLMPAIFAVQKPEILEVKKSAKMVKYKIASANGGFEAILYKKRNIPVIDHPLCLIGKFSIHRWQGRITCQMTIEDMQ